MGGRDERFLCDLMLGKLAVYLRLCGYDTVYAGDLQDPGDERLRTLATEEDRRLLSRDRTLVASTPGAISVESHDTEDQLPELRAAGITLSLPDRPLRCGRCNGRLADEPVTGDLPAYAPDDGTDCYPCPECGQLYWRGSHWDRFADVL